MKPNPPDVGKLVCRGTGRFRGLVALVCASAFLSCDLRTSTSSLENHDRSAYTMSTSGARGYLYLRMPWPELDREQEFPMFVSETPPGQSSALHWSEQVTVVRSPVWNSSSEYWFSWLLLHLLAIDREHLPDPVAMRSEGVESLFVAATRDPSSGDHDPFTRYIPPEVAGSVGAALSGTSSHMRFGFFLRAIPSDTPVVGSVVDGAPADLAGVRRDDRVLSVDGIRLDSAIASLDNSRPTSHSFRVFRPSSGRVLEFDVTTAEVVYPTVWIDTLPGGIGYVSISQFVSDEGVETDELFRDAMRELASLRRDKDGWILDLRDNGGGTIVSSQGVAGALLGANQPLVRVREREIDFDYLRGEVLDTLLYTPDRSSLLPSGTIHLLQDGGTASASELLLSALRETIRGRLVTYGERTYGKGIGQLYYETPLGAYVAVTCMHIDPLDSARYHHVGIPADIETTSGEALTRALAAIVGSAGAGRVWGGDGFRRGIEVADLWNRFERRATTTRPLVPSRIPGSLGIW